MLGDELTKITTESSRTVGQIIDAILFSEDIINSLERKAAAGSNLYRKYFCGNALRAIKGLDDHAIMGYIKDTYGIRVDINFPANTVDYLWLDRCTCSSIRRS